MVNRAANFRCTAAGGWPLWDSLAYVDPAALVIGNVHIGPRVYVGPGAVIRADECDGSGQVGPVTIGAESNVQDGVIIHALGGTRVTVGERPSLAHGCVIHGSCAIGRGCFVGFRAVVYNASLADGVFVSAGAIVQGADLAEDSFVAPATAVLSDEDAAGVVTATTEADRAFMERVVNANVALAEGYLRLGREE